MALRHQTKLLICCLLGAASTLLALELKNGPDGTAMVLDERASGSSAVAIAITEEAGQVEWPIGELAPGLYEAVTHLHLHLPAAFDHGRLRLTITLANDVGEESLELLHTQFNSDPARYTPLHLPLEVLRAGRQRLRLSWSIAPLPSYMKERPAMPIEAPTTADAGLGLGTNRKRADAADELADMIMADEAVGLDTITYPAILLDTIVIETLTTTLGITRVWPAKLHVYPGEANPVDVTVRNYSEEAHQVVVALALHCGLDEVIDGGRQSLEIAAGENAEVHFEWPGGEREFGYEARATLLRDEEPLHQASEYFSVGSPIWKTAIQGNGFLTWYGREDKFAPHVEANRRKYINVEEAFSWQPSSWDDLTPEGDDWWAGQNNYHNSRSGLENWLDLSHRHGIKMITYLFATASGPSGAETARRLPDTITHQELGLVSEFHDVEDLRLYALTHETPSLWRFQYGVWHSFSFNRGYLRTIELAMTEVIASAREFGWDGMRFDSPPSWGAMSAAQVHEEFADLGVAELMERLVPEYVEQREGNWDASAISVRNIRYARHRMREELGKDFAVSNNLGRDVEGSPFYQDCASDGGQIQHEGIRHSRSWKAYEAICLQQSELARSHGGYHCVCSLDEVDEAGRAYAAIYTFAGGSHPYGEWGYQWDRPLPGPYSRFMTRYGELCWSLDLTPASPAEAGFSVSAPAPLSWESYVRRRTLPDGRKQVVLHLITPPPTDEIVASEPVRLHPWQSGIRVTGAHTMAPAVWLLSAEPHPRAQRLEAEPDENGMTVTISQHHLWSILVWHEAND